MRLLLGNVFDKLPEIDDNSVDLIVTSPPYWRQRDYGIDDQIGMENTYIEYLEHLWSVFDLAKRVLKDTGSLYVNIGDVYWGKSGKRQNESKLKSKIQRGNKGSLTMPDKFFDDSMPEKSLSLIPSRFAIGMIDHKWILRNDIIWWKPDAMPESVHDRFGTDFEHIFFFVKNKEYYFSELYEMNHHFRTVWKIKHESGNNLSHHAIYPQQLVSNIISASCPPNGIVLDTFMGSGTTGVVAKKMNRDFIGIEISPEYYEISKDRINNTSVNISLFDE